MYYIKTLPVRHVQWVKITSGDQISEEGLSFTASSTVANDDFGAAI